jgi:hypothetical protein
LKNLLNGEIKRFYVGVDNEALSEISGIVDVKYSYEEHKELQPDKAQLEGSEKLETDWGKGLGEIQPHSDDLYESRDINAMSLTVCKDLSATPTSLWLLKDIIKILNDKELGDLSLSSGNFISGRNVIASNIKVTKPILRVDQRDGIGLRLDFRVDSKSGNRLVFEDQNVQKIFSKLKKNIPNLVPNLSHPNTGTVCLISNFRVLHGRKELTRSLLYEGENSRILFRSKGVRV